MQKTHGVKGDGPDKNAGNQPKRWTISISPRMCLGLCIATVVLVILLVVFFVMPAGKKSSRSESYKKVSGAAGLRATITYDCAKKPCHDFNFNVYILNDAGQQVNVIQPDKDGNVNAALPEGTYVMLVGKRFGKDNLFPEEPLVLKNGQELGLKLHYKEGAL